jgi:hypothetical protein
VGRLCEEFQCLPTEAWRELRRLPAGFLETIIEYRAYARAKAMVDAADTADARKRLPSSPLIGMAQEFDMRLAEEDHTAAA